MGRKIQIRAGAIEVTAELDNTVTAQAIWEALMREAEELGKLLVSF